MPTGFLDPKEILNQLPLKKDMNAADFGCGSGGWVIPLAKKLEDGTVFAIDVQESALSALQGKASSEKLKNIVPILADAEDFVPRIAEGQCDLVLMTNLIFQLDNPAAVFEQAKRILKKEGQILIVDWSKEAPFGPKEGRKDPQEIKEMADSVGLRFSKEVSAGNYHFAFVFGF